MYLKRVNGYSYYCMSVRKNGHISTLYLGRSLKEATEKERLLREKLGIGARGRPKKNWDNPRLFREAKSQARPFIVVPIVLILSMAILFNAGITGDMVANMSENLSQNLSSLGDMLEPLINGSSEQPENPAPNPTFNQTGNTTANETFPPPDFALPEPSNESVIEDVPENFTENATENFTVEESLEIIPDENITQNISAETEDSMLTRLKDETESRLGVKLHSIKRKGNRHTMDFSYHGSRIRLDGVNPDELKELRLARISHASLKDKTIVLGTETIFLNSMEMDSAEITLQKTGPVNAILRCTDFSEETGECLSWERTSIPFTDSGDAVTFTVDSFSGYAGAYITIINVQSYPTVGGEWTVAFTTEGVADLAIAASNGTAYGTSPPSDLEWLSLSCGSQILQPDFDGTRVFYPNWSCAETGYQTVRVLTEGEHTQEFVFGDDVAYAHNWAKEGNVYNCSNCSDCNDAIANASAGDIIQLNASITNQSGTCISFGGKDNVTFDCLGNTIDGENSGYGIWLNESLGGSNNNTIRNCTLTQFGSGVYLASSYGNTIVNITAAENTQYDINIYAASGANCANNMSEITGSGNRPIKYFGSSVNLSNEILSELVLCNADDSNITNVTVVGSPTIANNCLLAYLTDNSNFTGINSSTNSYGIYLKTSSNNSISNSTANNNQNYGIYLYPNCQGNSIFNSTTDGNNQGIRFCESRNNSVRYAESKNNQIGLYFDRDSNYNNVSDSHLEQNTQFGIYLNPSGASIPINNRVYNNYFNNTQNFGEHENCTNNCTNYWNVTLNCSSWPNIIGGPCIGGNYWTDPDGNFSDTCADDDFNGICDSTYAVATNNTDYLPLSDTTFVWVCSNLSLANTTYALAQNASSAATCFNITGFNITLDGKGHLINYSTNGTVGYGVYSGQNYSRVRNARIAEGASAGSNKYGVYFSAASNGMIENNTITTSSSAVYLASSSNSNRVLDNNITTTAAAIYLDNSNNNNLSRNSISTSSWGGYGIYVYVCANTTLENNSIASTGFTSAGILLSSSTRSNLTSNRVNTSSASSYEILASDNSQCNHTIDASNLADGMPVNYTFNASNALYEGIDYTPYGEVIFACSSNITIRGCNFSRDNVFLSSVSNSTLENGIMTSSSGYSLKLRSSNYNTFRNLSMTNTGIFGVDLSSSSYNNFIDSNITTNSRGFQMWGSSHNTLSGVRINSSGSGIDFSGSYNLTIYSIKIYSTSNGIYMNSGGGFNIFNNLDIVSSSYPLEMRNTLNLTVTNGRLNTSAGAADFFVGPNVNGSICNLTNITRADGLPINVSWSSGANGTLNYGWWLDVYANFTNGSAATGASILGYDNGSVLRASNTTNASGLARLALAEYSRNNTGGSDFMYYNNYTIIATDGIRPAQKTLNMSTNRMTNLTIDNTPPYILFTSPSPLNQSITPNDWVYVNVSSNDENNHSAFIDWNSSMVGWWRFNNESGENTTFFRDWSTWGNNGSCLVTACPNYTAGKLGKGVAFDGDNDTVSAGSASVLDDMTPLSISLWGKADDYGEVGQGYFASKLGIFGTGWVFQKLVTNARVEFAIDYDGGSDLQVHSNINTLNGSDFGTWIHWAVTWNGTASASGVHIYKNGIDVTASSGNTDGNGSRIADGAGSMIIGNNYAYDRTFNGSIDDVRIFNRALSAEEINASYNAGLYRLEHNFTSLADGTYNYRAYAQDAAGNVNQTEQRTVIVDLIPPQPVLTSPANDTYTSAVNVNATCTLTDNNGLGNVTLHVWNSTGLCDSSQRKELMEVDPSNSTWKNGLMLLMHFNNDSTEGENSTFFRDMSGNGNNGTCSGSGCPAFSSSYGKFRGGLYFDGGDRIEIPNSSSLSAADVITMQVWFHPYTLQSSWRPIVAKVQGSPFASNYWLGHNGNAFSYCFLSGGWQCSGTSSYQPGQWYHLVLTIDSVNNSVRLYVNNQLAINNTVTADMVLDNGSVWIGWAPDDDYIDGAVDEVAVWNRSLSGAEITDLYNRSKKYYQASLPIQGLSDGIYQWNYLSEDLVGNQNFSSSNNTLTIDTVNPKVEFVYPTPENGSGRSFVFGINASINELNLGSLVYNWNGTNHSIYDSSLVLFMNLDNRSELGENDSVVVDVGRSRTSGAVQGSAKPAAGVRGNAFLFNESSGDYIRINSTPSLDINGSQITIAFWFNVTDVDYDDGLVVKAWNTDNMSFPYYQYGVERISTSKLRYYQGYNGGVNWTTCDSGTFVATDRWWHAVFVKNATTGVWYIDGVQNSTCSIPAQLENRGNTNINLGADVGGGQGLTGMMDDVMIFNRSLSATEVHDIFTSSLQKVNQTQWLLQLNQSNLSIGKSYTYYLFASDLAGNSNATETRTVVGNMKPGFVSMSRSPSGIDEMDPNITITVTVNVSDSDSNLDTVILQWKNASAGWDQADNVSMQNLSAKGFSTLMNASFTPAYESNYTYRIWANDTEGEWNTSAEINISVFYDWTWIVDRSGLGNTVAGGFSTTAGVGTFMINNTGDFNMSFSISDNSPYDPAGYPKGCGLLYNGSCYVVMDQTASNQSSKGIKIYNVSATFGTTTREDFVTITILANPSVNATPLSRTVNVTLASYSGGPYFDALIDVYPSSMNHSDTAVFSAYLKNIGNETAQDVAINWTVPSPFGVSGNTTENAGNISPSVQNRYNLSLTASPATVAVGSYAISFNATGHGLENISDGHAVSFTVYCGQGDGVCGLGCTYIDTSSLYDQDCTAPAPVTITQQGIGGAAPAAVGLADWQKQKLFQTQETYELVRSTQQEFVLKVENPFGGSFENVSVDISGFLKQYLSIKPSFVRSIPAGGSYEFIISIDAPAYFSKGTHQLNFTITGVAVTLTQFSGNATLRKLTPVRENRIVTLIIHEISKEEAETYLNKTASTISAMKDSSLNTAELEIMLENAEESLRIKDFGPSKEVYDKAKDSKDNGMLALSVLEEVGVLIGKAARDGIEVPRTERLVMLSRAALERGDFTIALQRANDAKFTCALESFGVFNALAFVSNNWPSLSISAVILAALSYLGVLSVKFRLMSRRLKSLKNEEEVLLGLIKEIQKDCFEGGKLGMKEYYESLLQYEKKMSSVVQEIVSLEIRKANMLKLLKGELAKLLEERRKLLALIRDTQFMYLDTGNLETRIYENKMKSYVERMAEIEEKIAGLEVKKVTRRKPLRTAARKTLDAGKKLRGLFST